MHFQSHSVLSLLCRCGAALSATYPCFAVACQTDAIRFLCSASPCCGSPCLSLAVPRIVYPSHCNVLPNLAFALLGYALRCLFIAACRFPTQFRCCSWLSYALPLRFVAFPLLTHQFLPTQIDLFRCCATDQDRGGSRSRAIHRRQPSGRLFSNRSKAP